MVNEKQLVEEVEEFFNEEDTSVGLYAVGKIDKEIVEDFTEAFEEAEIVSYNENELYFKVSNQLYKVEISSLHEEWRMYRIHQL